jgi:hypothetical protein
MERQDAKSAKNKVNQVKSPMDLGWSIKRMVVWFQHQ